MYREISCWSHVRADSEDDFLSARLHCLQKRFKTSGFNSFAMLLKYVIVCVIAMPLQCDCVTSILGVTYNWPIRSQYYTNSG